MEAQQSIKEQMPTNPAETYESYMGPTFFGPWASRLIESAKPRPGGRVLDVGTGTGIVARLAASQVGPDGSVVGLDLSPDMLGLPGPRRHGKGSSSSGTRGRAERLPFPDGTFDLVLCQYALMFFVDQPAALAEMHRVLADGGRLALVVFQTIERHPFYRELDEAIQRTLGAPGVQQMFSLGDADGLSSLITGAGFKRVGIERISMTSRFPQPEAFLAGDIDVDTAAFPSMQHLDPPGRQAVTSAIREEMEGPLSQVVEDNHVVLPYHALIVTAER
jgi:ubiquinone/menaquinone biosynthesis C-methylase UbiE